MGCTQKYSKIKNLTLIQWFFYGVYNDKGEKILPCYERIQADTHGQASIWL